MVLPAPEGITLEAPSATEILVNAYAELASVELSQVVAQNGWRAAVVHYLSARALLADWSAARQ